MSDLSKKISNILAGMDSDKLKEGVEGINDMMKTQEGQAFKEQLNKLDKDKILQTFNNLDEEAVARTLNNANLKEAAQKIKHADKDEIINKFK